MSEHRDEKSPNPGPVDLKQLTHDLKKLRNKLSTWINDTLNPPMPVPVPVRVRARR